MPLAAVRRQPGNTQSTKASTANGQPRPHGNTSRKSKPYANGNNATSRVEKQKAEQKAVKGDTDSDTQSDSADDSIFEEDHEDDDGEDEEDIQANLEMDGQDIWAQNYCSVCDCLIEPGSGVGSRRPSIVPAIPAEQHANSSGPISPGLSRKSGTIKGRPLAMDESKGPTNERPGHLRRTGSSGSGKLNVLSDLKPTTKLRGDATAHPSPKTSRRSSGASTDSRTAGHGQEGSSGSGAVLPRSRKGGLLGGLTPAALRQQEEEELKAKAPPSLYCSERCRDIDEERQLSLSGLAELQSYVSQPPLSANRATSPWGTESNGPFDGPRAWPRTPSMTSVPMAYASVGLRTPDSEGSPCMCPDCLEKSSASGTVPSGASDSTESSYGFAFGRAGGNRKQRSQSGRMLTPQNLLPPGAKSDEDGYFPTVATRPMGFADAGIDEAPERTCSVASGTSSTRSSGSYASMWEPQIRGRSDAKKRQLQQQAPKRVSTVSERSATTASNTHGTNTPGARNSTTDDSDQLSAGDASQSRVISPLLLLRRGSSSHRSSPSVDVIAEQAASPGASKFMSGLGSSITSEQTLGTSANTLVHPESSLRERRHLRGKSLALDLSHGRREAFVGPTEDVSPTDDRCVKADKAERRHVSPNGDAVSTLRAAMGSRNDTSATVVESRRHSAASLPSSGWLSSLSSAWTNLRQGSVPHLRLPEQSPEVNAPGVSEGEASPSASNLGGLSIIRSSSRPNPSPSSDQTGSSNLSRSAASESLSRMLSAANMGRQRSQTNRSEESSAMARPGANRGTVPAFASEIGRGQIPGEAAAGVYENGHHRHHHHQQQQQHHASSSEVVDDEERRRRRKAEVRHRRSRDVTVLPPLLAPSSRSGSHVNLAQHRANSYANLNSAARARSKARSSTGSSGPTFIVGSVGSVNDQPPATPSFPARNSVGSGDVMPSPLSRPGSHQDVSRSSTSPRQAGLSWTSMTPVKNGLAGSRSGATSSASSEHLHSRSFGHGRYQAHHHHAPHHVHLAHHHGHHHVHRPTPSHGRHQHSHSHSHHHQSTHAGLPGLGHIGLLGHHPHGSLSAHGRHNTMPVRTSTPIVPEDGGEMSSAALTGHDDERGLERPLSAMSQHRFSRRPSSQTVSRPQSSLAQRGNDGSATAPRHFNGNAVNVMSSTDLDSSRRMWSYDNLGKAGGPGVKTYPVLHVPGRQQTHDRYDDTWNDTVDQIVGPERTQQLRAQQSQNGASATVGQNRRKQLFHFG